MRTRLSLIAALVLALGVMGSSRAEARGWHHRGWGGGAVVAGLIGGAILGTALSRPYYRSYRTYEPYYGYGYAPYYGAYAYPSYYAYPAYGFRFGGHRHHHRGGHHHR